MSNRYPSGLSPELLAAELHRCRQTGNLIFELPWDLAILWVFHLQLALRHPGLSPDTAERVRASLVELIDLIGTRAPKTREMLLLGFDESYDV